LLIFRPLPQNIKLGVPELPRELIEELERLIRRDPAHRGLIASEPVFGPLCEGHLAGAAVHLAEFAEHVAIVTGFFVPHGELPAAETDGPLGSLLLAAALDAIGVEVSLITDEHCRGALTAAATAFRFPAERVLAVADDSAAWLQEFYLEGRGRTLTHLIAVERVGPSHTPDSLRNQPRLTAAPVEEFAALVPAENRNRCHNMRGQVIDEHTANLHRLFEELPHHRPEARSIGIGDGANEIGMGSIPWEELRRRLDGDHAAHLPCRIATDWNIIAGTSNWGGYALAAATLWLQGRVDVLAGWDRDHQQRVLEYVVEHGPAVDGVTGRREPTVDGLPFLTYIQPWEGIRRLLGLSGES
jgi:hypothetical protein